jgi:hypothetical protein
LSAGISLMHDGNVIAAIHLEATLTGPTPWHVVGEAHITILLFDVSVAFDARFGEERQVQLPPSDPRPLLLAAIQDPRNWSTSLPPAAVRAVSLAPQTPTTPPGLVDPGGGVSLHQTVLPLNRQLTRFGATAPIGPDRYTIDTVRVGAQPVADVSAVRDFFAPAQFEALTDCQKLSRPSFERMDAGVTIAGDTVASGAAVGTPVVFETIVVDSAFASRTAPAYTPTRTHQLSKLRQGASARSPRRTTGTSKFAPDPALPTHVALADEQFVIASTLDLAHRADLTGPVGQGAAELALASYLATHPTERGRLQVVPVHELEVVA